MGLIVIAPDAEKHSRTYSLNSFAINKHPRFDLTLCSVCRAGRF